MNHDLFHKRGVAIERVLALLMQTNPGCLSRLASERLVRAWYRVTGCWRCRAVPLRDDFLPGSAVKVYNTYSGGAGEQRKKRESSARTNNVETRPKKATHVCSDLERFSDDDSIFTGLLLADHDRS